MPALGTSTTRNSSQTFYGDKFDISKRDQYELGYRANVLDWLNLEMTYFLALTTNDESYDEITNIVEQTGKTKRHGLEAAVDIRPFQDWNIRANYAYTEAKYTDYKSGGYDYDGRRITAVPRQILNLEIAYAPEEGFGGRASLRWEADAMNADQPSIKMDGTPNPNPFNTYKSQDKGTIDLQLNYRFNDSYKIVLDVLNVLDKDYYGYQGTPNYQYSNDYTYSFRPPRTIYLGLEMNWDAK
jgi:outer membrane receptor protein involved in Fe transport